MRHCRGSAHPVIAPVFGTMQGQRFPCGGLDVGEKALVAADQGGTLKGRFELQGAVTSRNGFDVVIAKSFW